jgi:hypothetical protein
MFGHGNKTPAPPKQPWALQFLTSDYLISSSVPPANYMLGSNDLFQEASFNDGADAFQLLSLEAVQLQSTGSLTAAPESLAQWTLGLCDNLIAVIPNDDPSRAAAQQAFKDYRQPQAAVFYVGQYVIIGHYLADPSASNIWFLNEKSLRPMADAEISGQVAGSTLKSWHVPWLLLNARQLHGYRLV